MNLKYGERVCVKVLSTSAACALLLACGNDQIILGDEAEPLDPTLEAPASQVSESEDVGVGGASPECSEHFEDMRESYDSWISAENDVGTLAGKTYRGHLDAGPVLEVRISGEGEIRAVFGLGDLIPPATVREAGYLCEATIYERCQQIIENVEYKVQGASYVGRRLQLPVLPQSPWEGWCELQIPRPHQESCSYGVVGHQESGFNGSEQCESNGVSVDCSWLNLGEQGLCACTSSECFLNAELEPVLMDLTFTPDGLELNGSVAWPAGSNPSRVWLELVD